MFDFHLVLYITLSSNIYFNTYGSKTSRYQPEQYWKKDGIYLMMHLNFIYNYMVSVE